MAITSARATWSIQRQAREVETGEDEGERPVPALRRVTIDDTQELMSSSRESTTRRAQGRTAQQQAAAAAATAAAQLVSVQPSRPLRRTTSNSVEAINICAKPNTETWYEIYKVLTKWADNPNTRSTIWLRSLWKGSRALNR